MNRAKKGRRRAAGYTMIELLAAMTVLGVLFVSAGDLLRAERRSAALAGGYVTDVSALRRATALLESALRGAERVSVDPDGSVTVRPSGGGAPVRFGVSARGLWRAAGDAPRLVAPRIAALWVRAEPGGFRYRVALRGRTGARPAPEIDGFCARRQEAAR